MTSSKTKYQKESSRLADSANLAKIRCLDDAVYVQAVYLLVLFFSTIGAKLLLKNYECPLGAIDMVVKHRGRLFFIGIDRDNLEKPVNYYLKRYGIRGIEYDVVSL